MTRTGRRRFPILLAVIAALAMAMLFSPVQAQEGSAPDAPTGLTVASVSHDSVELDWDDSGDSSITHYQVFRRDRAVHDAGEFAIIEEDTGSTATEYTDATVEADEEYVYRVKAVNAYGASPWSDHVRADTPTGPGQEAVYTYEDGDRTIRVILQGDLVIQETGADTPSDDVVRRTAGGNIVRKPSGQGGADLPVFRSASGGALMTLPGGVLLALDPEWDRAAVNGFFARNNISKGRISELDYIPNGFFVRTEPGFPSLELANALAAQKGVLLSSPNWWREVRQDPGEPKGDDRRAAQETGDIEDGFMNASDLPLGTTYNDSIDPPENYDFFKLDLSSQSGTTDVRIYTTGEFDTSGLLFDIDKYLIERGNDSIGTRNFSLLASLQPGVYYVVVFGAPYAYNNNSTDTGNYTLHAETITATRVSLGSSVTASIGAAGEFDYFKLDLSGQTGDTDVSLFTVSDDLLPFVEGPSGSLDALRTVDTLVDRKWVTHWSDDASLSPGVYLFTVGSLHGDTGDYSLRAAAMPDHGSNTATATTLSLDAPTSGKITSASDADYLKLVLTEAKNLVILAFAQVNAVVLDSGGTEIPVNKEIRTGGFNSIIDDFASGTYYVKITAPDASSSDPDYYALYAYEDTGYGTWVDGCADDTDDLDSSTINDPLYACQWHLNSGDSAGMDINVESVWVEDITGAGVNVAVVDYTIDYSHDDLSPNINTALNHDYGGRGNTYRPAEHHGTWVAGVLAARDNTIGVRGVAPRATIYGHNILADGYVYVTDVNEADAMARNRVATAVSNNSWGPVDGYAFDHAPAMWEIAIDSGVTQGYDGKGVFYAWAGGNGHRVEDSSNFDEYANYYGVTAVCAVDDDGIRSAYSEQGANLWVCAPSHDDDRGIVTTENSDRYTNTFGGTSSATPKVSGVAALLRHANPDLTWRDLKLILAASARQNDASNAGWEEGARKYGSTDDSDRYHFNHEYGFGVVDAAAAVALARDWRNLPEFKNASSASGTLNRTIPDNTASGITSSLSLDTEIDFTEFVEVNVTIDHTLWRDLRIELVSPAGTVSTLATPVDPIRIPFRPPHSTVSPGTFRFGSAKHLGEDPDGAWTLRVADELASDQGTLTSWSIKVYGHRDPAPDLVVEPPTVSHSNPVAGTPFTLRATVRNQGGAAAGSTTLRYYRSTNDTISTSDTAVGTKTVSGLAAAGTSAESIDLTAPTSAGTYYYGACVDAVTNESDRTNNCSTAVRVTAAPQQPNTSLSPSVSDPYAPPATVVYTVTFEGQWDAAATPGGVPRGAHFSRLIGALHNSGVTFLRSGETASDGVESMAEEGGWMSLRDEVENAGTNALDVLMGDTDNIGPTTSKAHTLTVTAEHPRVTLLTMIAPSPDWFVGVSGLTLLDDQGDWVESVQVDLYPWDAGTEDGGEFSLSNSATSPQGVITNIRGTGKFSNARIATLTFTRQSVNPGPTGTPAFIGEQRVGEVLRVDTSSIDDPDGFTNRDFSFTWLADNDLKELGAFLRGLGIVNAYEIAPYDFGMTIKVQIHFADDLGNREVIVLQAPSTVAAAAPDQPRNLSASPGGPGELDLSWSTPAVCDFTLEFGCWLTIDRMFNVGDGGSDITGYTVQWKLSSGDWGTASDVSEAEITETSYAITGLASSNTYAVRVRARNVAGLGTPSTEVTVSGASLNVGPVVSGRASPYFFEGNPRDVTTYIATDPESDGITWSLSGDDASFFSIANGVLNFDSAGDFEDPQDVGGNNAYDLNILASDGQNTAIFPVTVVIRDVEDERPVITGDNALTFAEGTDTTTVLQTYSATDPEGVNTTFTWYLVGTDSGDFEINAGALTFKNVPDFDSPADADGDNVYNVQVRAEDATKTAGLDVTVTVTNVNEAPEITGVTTIDDYDENGTGHVAIYTAADPEGDSTITWTLGGTDRGDFDITGGVLTFKSAPDYERPADSGRNNEYSIQIRANDGSLTGTKNVTVTVSDVNEGPTISGDDTLTYPENTATTRVLDRYSATDPEGRQITWSVTGTDENSFRIDGSGNLYFVDQPDYDAPSDSGGDNEYNIEVVAKDDGNLGDGTPSLLGTLSSSLDVTVTVTAVNESPTVDGQAQLTIFENDEGFSASYSASDPEGVASTFTWSVTGTDRGDFVIDRNTGELTFRNTPNYESPTDSNGDNVYLITVRATDEDGLIGSLEVTATVSDFDEPPTITGSATPPDFPENSVRSVATYQATDPEGRTITWGLSGTDTGDFNIAEGVLTFANIPDFERPTDSNRDNEYLVTVQARDEGGRTASLGVTVTVINSAGAEEPSITTSRPSLTLQENGTGTIYTFRARDPQGRPIRWSLTGADESNFTISDGALTFKNPPDFERPADANRDNVYELTVVVTDEQGLTDSFDFTVTVTNHHENQEPAITTSPSSGLTYQKLNYQENRTSTVHTYRARNYGPGPISWTLTGTDSGSFDISPQGALTFRSAPNYEALGSSGNDNDYEITVVASNSGGYSDTLGVVITVTDVNEGPEVTGGSPNFTISENQDLPNAVYTARDPEGLDVTRWTVGGRDGGDFTISQEGVLTFRNIPDFERPADSGGDNVYEVTVRPYDGRYYGSFDVTVTVTDVNERPTITTTSSSATALLQNENVTSRLYTYQATDPEGADTVTWSVEGVDARFFTIDESGGQFSFKEENAPDFEDPADSGGDRVYNVEIQATDDADNADKLDVTVTVRDVNEGPEVTRGEPNFTISENQDLPNAVYMGFDPEGGSVTRWTVGGRDGGDFIISQEGVLTFRSLPNYESPADSDRDNVYQLQVRPYDGRYYGSFDVTVTVNDVNEPPTITTTSGSSTALRQNENVTSRLYTYRATDPEGADTVTWSVGGVDARFFDIDEGGQFSFKKDNPPDFEQPADSGRDNVYNVVVQAADDGGNIDTLDVTVTVANDAEGEEPTITTRRPPATYRENDTRTVYTFRASDPQRGPIRWSLEGTDREDFTITADGSGRGVLAFISPPDYEKPADSDGQNDYELTVIATDEDDNVDRLSFTITVIAVDEGPEVSGPSSFEIDENGSLPNAVYTATDPEGSNVARWSVGGRDGGDFFITQGGTLYFRSPPDYERPADSDRDNVYEVTIQPSDGRNNGAYPVTVTVTDVDEPPEFRKGSKDTFSYRENGAAALYTYRATDPEGADVTWSVSGADAGRFDIGGETGVLTFREPPDHDDPADDGRNNEYQVTVVATDQTGHDTNLPVTVTVTEVNEGPVITRDGNLFGSPPGSVPENTPVTRVLATYTATDPERPGVKITQWSTAGRDGGDFVINALGHLMFRNAPDYERPADSDRDNVYEVTIRASDGRNTGTLEEVQRVTVTDVDEAPIITTTSRTAFTLQENRTSTLYTFRATDPEGGTVIWTPAGPDGSHFAIDEGGALSFANPPDYEEPADSGQDNVYEVTIRASDGRNTGTLEVTVTVTDHNEGVEPTISTRRPPATYRENGTSAVYTFRATDPQRGATITWTLEGTDRGDFTIGRDTGVLTFATSPDFEIPADADRNNEYELAVVATDDDGNTDRLEFTITVTDHNEGVEPTISTRRPPATYRENDTRTVYTFRASDPQRDTITWTLEGTDRGDFTIDRDTGVLTFATSPDFEIPADADRNNEYELAVVATDDDGNTDRVDFTIAVTDINEGPVIRLEGTETTTVSENTPDTKVLADYTATDPDNPQAAIDRWSTAGRDGGDFVISDLGELRFRSSPDYERPADSDRNNVYEVTVRAYDGRVYGAHDVTVTVTQMNEAPVITTKSRTEFTLRENFTAVLYTYRATDQDEDDAVTWSVEGADGGDFAIYKGILNFRLLPDLENPADEDGDNVYEITVVAADRAGLRDTVDAVITITDQSEGPVIAGKTSHTVAENYDIAQVLGSYTATDAKDNRPVHPRWSLSGRDGGDFTINEAGELTFRNIPDYDRPADANRDNVYEVTVRGHDSRAYGNLNVTVTVTAVNEHAPVVTGRETLSFRENTAVETRLHIYRATDGDRDTSFTWSLEGDDEDDFAIDQGGVLTFKAPPDYEDPADKDDDNVYQVTVVASDGAQRGNLDVTVTVTEQNEGPVVSGAAEFTIKENLDLAQNQGGYSTAYTARDPEAVAGVATTIRWSVSGRDGGDFTIGRDTGVLTFRTPPDHERPADANRDSVYEVTVRAHDGRNYGDFQVTVTVEDVAEITGPDALSPAENFEGVLATYSPAGQGDLAVEPSWRLTGADSGDFTIDRESGNLTFRSTPDHERPADSNRDNVYNFTVQVSDGSYHGTLDVTVTVDAVNEPPVVTGRDSLSFRENTPITTRLHTYRATDPERAKVTWSVTGDDDDHFKIGSETGVLTFREPPDFDIPSGSGTHGNEYLVTVVATDGTKQGTLAVIVTVTDVNEGPVIEVSGTNTAIKAEENTATDEVLATYTATDPENAGATIRWSLSGRDGGDFLINPTGELTFRNTPDYDRPADSNRDNEYEVTVRAYDGRTYGNLDVTITVSNVNEHGPVIRSGSRTSFTYREEGTAALYTYRATDGDKDDVIRWTTEGTDGGDFTIDGDTGELTFREPPDYEHPEDSGGDNVYELTVVATDSDGRSASLDVTVTVTAVDEGPEITGATTHTVSEGQDLTGAIFTAQDPEDADAAVTSWRLAGSDAGDFTITGAGGNSARLTFRNTPDYDRPADSNRDNEYLVTIRAYNGSTYGSLDVTVKVTDENEAAPVVTGRDTLSFRENTATTTRLHTYRATDTDLDTKITWSVEGADVDDFAIAEGVLTFRASPDYEDPTDANTNNVYEITVVAWDSTKRGTLDVTVTVTDVNEGPVIDATSTNTAITAEENTATDEVLATYTATDPENAGATIRWSVTGRDGGDFTIDRDTGKLTFRNPPDHERAADSGRDNEYEVTVRASDGRVYGTLDVTVTVTPVDEAPEFRRGSRDSFSYRENGTASLYTYRATDPEGDEVTWSVTGRDGGQFTIDRNTGVLSFLNPPDYDDPTDDGHDNEYLVTVVATDQTGRATSLPVTVTVTDVNEGPVIADTGTNTDITVDENYDQVLATYSATDPEDQPVTRWSVTGRDGGDFTISDGGELTFRNPPDIERPADANRDSVYEVTVRASDGRHYGTLDVVVTVDAVDEAPEFQRNTQDSFVYPENGASAIYTYRATDPEGSDVTWGLSGTDSGAFSIGKTGVLTFKLSPDYEDPADRNDDNVYQVVVQASDDSSPRNTNPLDVTVTVTNLTDARAVIRGTAQVGRTLTAETSGIPDKDRSDRVDFSYQWLADETDVEGATDPTYEITERDEGKTIKVRVTFTDNAGREETLTSAATAPVKPAQSNEPATGLPAINGTAQVGETLTADTSGVADADGLSNVQYEYQWLADDSDIAGATNATYTLTDSEESKAITVQVRFTDDADNEETLTSTATDAVAAAVQTNSPANGAPTISGTAQVGETLTANTSGIADADGLSNVQYEYQWLADDSDIAGATNATYTLTDSEESKAITVQVGFSDDRGNDEALTSAATGAVAARPAQLTATFPASPFQSSRHKGDDDRPQVIVAFNLPVQSFDKTTPSVSLTGATVSSLVRHEEDGLENAWVFFLDPEGNVVVVFTLVAGQSCDMGGICTGEGKMLSEGGTTTLPGPDEEDKPDNTDSNEPNSPATGLPTINGTAQVGETLTADTSGITDADGLSNVPYEYQWLADDSDISGATNATYTLAAEDEGKAITVRVSFTDDAGNEETLTSAATDAVAAASTPNSPATGVPTISGTAQVGETLTANTTGIADADGLSSVQYEYQWLADDSDISGATNATYTLADADEGKAVSLQVSFTDDADNEETLTSAATGAVAGPQPTEPPTKPSGLSATASHDSVTLTWDDPGDDTITGYVILRRIPGVDPEGQFDELVADTGTAATTYTDGTVSAEARYTYRIKAINEHGVSERSRWVHIDTPAAPAPEAEQAAEPPAKATGLSSEVSHNMVILTWDDPNDDSITGYLILRRDKDIHEEGTFLTVAPDTGSSETTYVDAAIEPERRYVYRIKAINASGVSEMSSWVRAYTPAVPDPAPEAPAKPTSLSATFSHDSVTLAWDDPGDDSITGYVILRRDKDLQPEDGTLFTVTSDTGSAGTTYTDDTAEPDKRYVYRIKAINEHGEMSEISSWVRAYTPAAP